MITTTEHTTIETTAAYRTHWIEPTTGVRYETRWARGQDGHIVRRDGLRPVLNLDEVREYVRIGIEVLPDDPSVPPLVLAVPGGMLYTGCASSVWYAHHVLTGDPVGRTEHVLMQLAEELTDDVPRYHADWRAPFVASHDSFAPPPSAVQA